MTLFNYISDTVRAIFTLDNPWKTACIAIGSLVFVRKGLTTVLRLIARRYLRVEEPRIDYEPEVVYLFVFPRAFTKQSPNLSPYAIKVETWLRLKKIKYEIIETTKFSKDTKQIPYIHLNNVLMSDSSLIIDYLTTHFKLDSDEGLNAEQLGAARAFQRMVDDATSWTYLLDRYVYRPHLFAKVFRPRGRNKFIREKMRAGLGNMFETRAHHQGSGRHSPETVAAIGQQDLKAISRYLDDKEFLMGDQITTVDCAVFGHLSQIAFIDFPYALKDLLNTDCMNIRHYLYRVRQRLWPDWFLLSEPGEFND